MATQHVLTWAQYREAGGDPPDPNGYEPTDDTVVIVCTDDTTGAVQWVSYAENDIDPAERLNPDVPALDYREA